MGSHWFVAGFHTYKQQPIAEVFARPLIANVATFTIESVAGHPDNELEYLNPPSTLIFLPHLSHSQHMTVM